MAITHKKCWPEWFEKFCSGDRTFELRLADFDLKTGDVLLLEEYNPETKQYTGRKAEFKCKKVEHSAQDPLQFYNVDDVRKYGFWIVQLEKKLNIMIKERFKIIPSVYLILIKDNKILLSRRYNTGYRDGYYSLPAGHLDGNETFKQGTVREAKEEIGVMVEPMDLELVHTMDRMILDNERADFFFTAKKWQGEPRIMEPEKCDDLSWFDLNNLPENMVPYIKQAIDSFLSNIIYSEREGVEK